MSLTTTRGGDDMKKLLSVGLVFLGICTAGAQEPKHSGREIFCEEKYPQKTAWQEYVVECKVAGESAVFHRLWAKKEGNLISEYVETFFPRGSGSDFLAKGSIAMKSWSVSDSDTGENTLYLWKSGRCTKFRGPIPEDVRKEMKRKVFYRDEVTSDYIMIGDLKAYRLKAPIIQETGPGGVLKYDYVNKEYCQCLETELTTSSLYTKVRMANVTDNFSDDVFVPPNDCETFSGNSYQL